MKRSGVLQPSTTLLAAATSSLFSGIPTCHSHPPLPFSYFLQMWPRWLTSSNPEAIHPSCSSCDSLPSLMAAEQPRLLERPAVESLVSNKPAQNGISSASALAETESTARYVWAAPDANNIRHIRHSFRRYGDPGFRVLGDALKRGVDPILIFRSLIDGFCEAGRTGDLPDMFESMLHIGWLLDSRTCSALVSAMYDKGKAGTALFLLNMMPKLGFRPDVVICNRVLRSLSRCALKHSDRESRSIIANRALELFEEMISILVIPDTFTYFFLIKCCCSAGKVDQGLSLLADMLKRGCQAKRGMMNALIYELIRENRIAEACILFDRMAAMGCKPNVYSFNAILKALCQTGDAADVLALYEELKEQGNRCKPNMFTYNTVIGKLCKEKEFRWALHVFDEMLSNDLSPNVVTYNIFMHYLCEQKWIQKAQQLFSIMVERGEKPTAVSYNILMHAYCLAGEMETAKVIYETMIANGIQRNAWSYNILCDGYCKNKKMKDASKLLSEMNIAGIKWNDVTYTLLIDFFYKMAASEKASYYKNLMEQSGLDQNIITYSSQMSYYCSHNLVDTAANIFKSMIDNNYEPDVVSYSILIKGYCTSERVDKAFEYFKEMLYKGLKPNTVICTILLSGLLNANRVTDAKQLYDEMRLYGIMPTMMTYSVMIDGLIERGCLDEANEIFFHRDDYYSQLLSKREMVMTLFDRMKTVKKKT